MFGIPNLKPMTAAQLQRLATPPAGNSSEVIFHQLYDTQTLTSALATNTLNFFAVAQADTTLGNLPQAGQLPYPQIFQIWDVALDLMSATPVSTSVATTAVGTLDDLARTLIGSAQRPTWQLNIADKKYGPYSLSALHGTGGPSGWGWGAEVSNFQYARNEPSEGWNYFGNIIIKQQVNFNVVVTFAATPTLNGTLLLRLSLFGALNRQVS